MGGTFSCSTQQRENLAEAPRRVAKLHFEILVILYQVELRLKGPCNHKPSERLQSEHIANLATESSKEPDFFPNATNSCVASQLKRSIV